ncbi:MAG: hypothetical protein LBQ48_01770, partial [Oscillospiraceae bacterium]|nr:hypothetical protein [Oscillospiraceae bacterium]
MQFYEINLNKLKRYPIAMRKNKVNVNQFAPAASSCKSINILDLLPDILTAQDLKEVVQRTAEAHANERAVIFA